MELRSFFVLYLDYYERKSLQKRAQSPVPDIVSFIQHELQESGSLIGYRAMQQRCIKNWMNVSRSVVSQIMRDIDLLVLMKDRGQHWDVTYTTLKVPTGYGILIVVISLNLLGLISTDIFDEYSRCILWLQILRSNKDPKEVCNVFVSHLTVTKGVPRKVAPILGRRTFL